MIISAGRVLLPEGFVKDLSIYISSEGIITGFGPAQKDADIVCDLAVPGMIDEHTHGGFGADVMTSDIDELAKWLDLLLENGVTQVLAGVYTYDFDIMRGAMERVKTIMRLQAAGELSGARMTGVHLEGPFISRKAPGAMNVDAIAEPTTENWRRLTRGYEDIIRLVTLAPEVQGADELINEISRLGIPVIAGHTRADAEEGRKAFSGRVGGVCHFFNASTPIHHREPGILTEALLNDRIYCECICDFVHVHPSCVKLIYRCKGPQRMVVVSDAVTTTGLPDGVYEYGTEKIRVTSGASRTLEGALAGGGALPLKEVKNLISVGIPEAEAFRMASLTPAEHLRIKGGRIAVHMRAEVCCLDDSYAPVATVLGDRAVWSGKKEEL